MRKKFLIGQLGRFGDCLYATALAKQIKNDYPDCHLTWAIAENYKSILELNPDIDSVWEIPATDGDYAKEGWEKFENEALKRQNNGEFDEIFLSQITPRNWIRFNGTIRGAILSAYQKPMTVSVAPVIRLTETEVNRVKIFTEKHQLSNFKHTILFECAPGSEQSAVDIDFAERVAKVITEQNKDVCFILSSQQKLKVKSPQIIDASELSFRENAELTKYCTLLIGCSSGITWLSTSDWAKKLPMVQLLNSDLIIYAGVHFDFELNNLDSSQVLEMVEFDENKTVDCVNSIIENGFETTKLNFHQIYKPNFNHGKSVCQGLLNANISWREIKQFVKNYAENVEPTSQTLPLKYSYLMLYTFFYHKLKKLKQRLK